MFKEPKLKIKIKLKTFIKGHYKYKRFMLIADVSWGYRNGGLDDCIASFDKMKDLLDYLKYDNKAEQCIIFDRIRAIAYKIERRYL